MKRSALYIVYQSSVAVSVFFVLAFFGQLVYTSLYDQESPNRVERPVVSVRDFAVDGRGTIFVGIGSRIQRYSSTGQFELAWQIRTSGIWSLRTAKDGTIEVATARANKFLIYSRDGQLLSETRGRDRYTELQQETESRGELRLSNSSFRSIVDRRGTVVIQSRPWAGVFEVPLVIFLMIASTMMTAVLHGRLKAS